MLYYKFKNDEKGELNELCIAARFPNMIPKRVIIHLSIAVAFLCKQLTFQDQSKRIAQLEEDLPLRMYALLLLGISKLTQKKSQLLLSECLRLQSELVEVKSLDKKSFDLGLAFGSDQHINLPRNPGCLENCDVDITMDEGKIVDEWVRNVFLCVMLYDLQNFGESSLLNDSFTSSSNPSLSGTSGEVDMLRRYTQQTILDDLLPQSDQSLMGQAVEVESRRGNDGASLNLSILNRASGDSMGMDFDLNPLSPEEY